MKILDADVFYDVVNETFPHDVISKEDILNLIDEMAVESVDVKNSNTIKADKPFKVPLSHYKIVESHIVSKSGFKDSNHIDTVKPGTFLGFTDSKGNPIDIDKINGK